MKALYDRNIDIIRRDLSHTANIIAATGGIAVPCAWRAVEVFFKNGMFITSWSPFPRNTRTKKRYSRNTQAYTQMKHTGIAAHKKSRRGNYRSGTSHRCFSGEIDPACAGDYLVSRNAVLPATDDNSCNALVGKAHDNAPESARTPPALRDTGSREKSYERSLYPDQETASFAIISVGQEKER